MRPGTSSVIAGAAFLAASVLGALVLVTARGRGAGDVAAFVIWSVPGAVLALGAARLLSPIATRSALPVAYLVHSISGTGLGIAWAFAAAASLGPWFRAFSFPVAPIWTITGGLSLIAAVVAARGRGWLFAAATACIPVACTAALIEAAPAKPLEAIVTLKSGATQEDATEVLETVICQPVPGKGYRPRLGISTIGPWDIDGKKQFKLGFHQSTDASRRLQILQEIAASSLVSSVQDVQSSK